MTTVFLVRHPQTTWNTEGRFQGGLEAPLTAEGSEQALLLAASFVGQPLAGVYTSPIGRAANTARLISDEAESPLFVDERLSEINMGAWEGLDHRQVKSRFPDVYRNWYSHPTQVTFPGGESLHDVQRRACDALGEIFERFPLARVAVVTHSVVVQVLAASALRLELDNIHRITVSNSSVTTICGDEIPGTLVTLNATDERYRSAPTAAGAGEEKEPLPWH
ncbi:MAG: histidine phosphatase family protein [Chloroflexota bacterium]